MIFNEQAYADETAGPGSAERLWTALTPSLRKFGKHAKIVCISTPDGPSGKFFELCESAQGGSLATTSRFEQWATWDLDPTVTEEQKAAWRADLGQALFEHEYGAQFVDAAGSFFDLSEVEFTAMPARPGDGENWIAALDPAFHADSFGVALVGRSKEDSDVLLVGMVEGLKPKGAAKSFGQRRGREDATLAAIGELIAPYEPHAIVSDQHNASAIQSHFGRHGKHVEIVSLTRSLPTAAFVTLRSRLIDGSLVCWRHPMLIEELRRVRAKDTETIFLPRYGDSHCDLAAALALGVSQADRFATPLVGVVIPGRWPSHLRTRGVPRQSRYSSSVFG